MEDSEAYELLVDAGVPEDMIGVDAITIASAIGDGVAQAVAKKIAQRFMEAELPGMIRTMEAIERRYAELGIHIHR